MNKKTTIILFTFLALIAIIFFEAEVVNASKKEKYDNNEVRISQIGDIKEQLHTLATLVRNESVSNNGFDKILSNKWAEYDKIQNELINENQQIQNEVHSSKTFLGYFKITHYCPCSKCNGGYTGTAIGTTIKPCVTIAVDPKVIPLRSKVEIDGNVHIAEDTGGAIRGNRIDVAVSSHSEAYRLGVRYNVPVYIIND